MSPLSGLHTNDSLNVKDDSGKVLINVNHNKDDPDIFLHKTIGDNLKPHQVRVILKAIT